MTDIKEHMEVIGADGVHVGTVDKVEGNRIKLSRKAKASRTRRRELSIRRTARLRDLGS